MITIHQLLEQGSEEWHKARCGLLTASEVKLILTPTLKIASNDKERAHLYELLAQRVTGYTEPQYIGDDMLRGMEDEIDARAIYDDSYGDVTECGFITRDFGAFTIGYSPDGLVGDAGLIEVKSRRAKYQLETILSDEVPEDYLLQLQTGLLVSGREWIDYISYSAGLPMFTKRVLPCEKTQAAIIDAATKFHENLDKLLDVYNQRLGDESFRLIPTERKINEEISL